MSRQKVFGLLVVVSLLLVAVWLGTRRWVTQQHNDKTSEGPAAVVQEQTSAISDNLIWRLKPDSTCVHTVLPISTGSKWPRDSGGGSLSLALVEQTYTALEYHPSGAREISSNAYWVVEFAENTSITLGRVVGLVHPEAPTFYGNGRDAQFVYYPQIDKFLVIVSESSVNTYIHAFEVESNRIHVTMILPKRSEDWPPQMSCMAGAGLDNKRGFASEPSGDFDPSIIVGTKRYPFGVFGNTALDFFAYSPRHRQWAIVGFTHVALPSNSGRSSKPPIGPATTWEPVANSGKVIAASSSRYLTVVEQDLQRESDSDDSKIRTKAYWVLQTYDGVVPSYFLPPDESRRIECAQIVNIGLPHQEPYYLAAAEIDGTELVIRYYSMTEKPKGSRPLELDTIPKHWPTRIEPTAELRIKSPVKKLESFIAYGSSGNLIFGVADESSQAYFNHFPETNEWTRLEIRNRLQIKE